jgi:hypothetical protein
MYKKSYEIDGFYEIESRFKVYFFYTPWPVGMFMLSLPI